MEQISVTRHIPVKYTADICVVGAGPAGVAAAVTAARRGGRAPLRWCRFSCPARTG